MAGKKTGKNPTDRAKIGAKRSLLTEAKGIPIAIENDGANRHDVKLFESTINNIIVKRPKPTKKKQQGMCLDAGYVGDDVDTLGKSLGFTMHVRPRGEEAKEIKKPKGRKARRWVVERTHSWVNRFRGVLIRWCKKSKNYMAMLHLVCGIIVWRSTDLLR